VLYYAIFGSISIPSSVSCKTVQVYVIEAYFLVNILLQIGSPEVTGSPTEQAVLSWGIKVQYYAVLQITLYLRIMFGSLHVHDILC